jgi:hypothetical protein
VLLTGLKVVRIQDFFQNSESEPIKSDNVPYLLELGAATSSTKLSPMTGPSS